MTLCAQKLPQLIAANEQETQASIVDEFHSLGKITVQDKDADSPLVKQSGEFASIINPPPPPEPPKIKEVKEPPKITRPVLSRVTAKFKLLATSCNRARPEDSVALIDEPGKGEHWAKVGDIIGNFVLERIEPGSIIYRNGNQSSEMAVEVKPPVRIAQERTKSILN